MKIKILRALKSHQGDYVSGEEIAQSLGVSRAAVWKGIASLRKEGYKISASTKKGYLLEKFSDVLSEKGILANLRPDTKVSQVFYLSKTDSTNNYAKRLAVEGGANGTLVVANCQTSGRGRHGHSFESPAGTGLYMSLIIRPKYDVEKFQMITIADAVAVCLAIEDLYPEAKGALGIKWVNDVLMRGRKICGILTEAVTGFESGEVESVVTGIGINVSTKEFDNAGTAGSIFVNEPVIFGRDELCARVADYVMTFAENLNDPSIMQAYRERDILTGHDITFMKDDEKCYGHVEGIDDNGGLIIKNKSGEIETLRSGEVFMIRESAPQE